MEKKFTSCSNFLRSKILLDFIKYSKKDCESVFVGFYSKKKDVANKRKLVKTKHLSMLHMNWYEISWSWKHHEIRIHHHLELWSWWE